MQYIVLCKQLVRETEYLHLVGHPVLGCVCSTGCKNFTKPCIDVNSLQDSNHAVSKAIPRMLQLHPYKPGKHIRALSNSWSTEVCMCATPSPFNSRKMAFSANLWLVISQGVLLVDVGDVIDHVFCMPTYSAEWLQFCKCSYMSFCSKQH